VAFFGEEVGAVERAADRDAFVADAVGDVHPSKAALPHDATVQHAVLRHA
jgi:hypothetical protein